MSWVSGFFTKNPNLYNFFFRGDVEGVVWRGGSVARVSKFFLTKNLNPKQNNYHHPSPCSY